MKKILIGLVLSLAALNAHALNKYIDTVTNSTTGRAIRGATVEVKNYPGLTSATIYSDDGTTLDADSTVSTDADGFYQFYVASGRYTLVIRHAGATVKTVEDVQVGPPATGVATLRDYGAAVGDGTTNDTAAVNAADAVGGIYVPAGIYDTTLAATALDGPFWGRGQIRDSANRLRAPFFSAVKSRPSTLGDHDWIETAFNGDISQVQFPVEHRIVGTDTLGQPASGYLYTPETSPFYLNFRNESGWNESTSGNDGRTAAVGFRVKFTNAGQGDMPAFNCSGFVTGTRAGSTNFLANPAVSCINGDFTADTDGTYLNPGEWALNDNGKDVAGIGWVINLNRSVTTGAKGAWWAGYRVQSQGSAAADSAFSASGKFNYGLDLSFTDLGANQAAVSLKGDQRIYLNATATDATGLSRYPSSPSTTWLEYDVANTGILGVVNNSTALLLQSNTFAFIYGSDTRIATASNNSFRFLGAANGSAPELSALGASDANVDLKLSPKGTGLLQTGYATTAAGVPANFAANRIIAIKDSSGTTYYIPAMAAAW